jgi:hypothetical protein
MRKDERDAVLRQGVVLPELPETRRQLAGLREDIDTIPARGNRLDLRLRNFVPTADSYLASLGGPLPYMVRLREIEAATRVHEVLLEERWRTLAAECADAETFAARWEAEARDWPFDEVNDLIERHNRWYPAESRLPMDPRTGDFARVNGRHYRRERLGTAWILGRFPPELTVAAAL